MDDLLIKYCLYLIDDEKDSDLLEKLRTREGEMKRRMQLFVPLYNILSQFYNLILT